MKHLYLNLQYGTGNVLQISNPGQKVSISLTFILHLSTIAID